MKFADLVDEIESRDADRGRAFVSAKLDLMRARNEKLLLQQLSPGQLDKLNGIFKQCERKLLTSVAHANGQPDPLDTALQQYMDLAREFEPLDRKNIHEFRKSCKQVRYLAELGAEGGNKEKALEQLKQIQDKIGDWHDLLILNNIARKTLKHPKRSALIDGVQKAQENKFQEALTACHNAMQELLRLQLQRMVGRRKQPRSAGRSTGRKNARAA